MIRAILHLLNDQPLVVDVLDMPTAQDVTVICTNLRTVDGKKPVFIDYASSTFMFPLSSVRFVEIPPTGAEQERAAGRAIEAPAEPEDLEIDEDFLRRVREA